MSGDKDKIAGDLLNCHESVAPYYSAAMFPATFSHPLKRYRYLNQFSSFFLRGMAAAE